MRARLACVAIAIAWAVAGCPSSARRAQPDPAECATAADCAPGPLVDPNNVCCDSGMHAGVFSRRYLEWRAKTVAAECKPSSCPPQPSPAPPMLCATQPRCVANRCTGSCEP